MANLCSSLSIRIRMKLLWIALFLSSGSIGIAQQQVEELELIPGFTAIIVEDINRSSDWYQGILGYQLIQSNTNNDIGLSQFNLKRGMHSLELIQLESAQDPEEVIEGYNQKSKLLGIFKTGFMVKDFDKWMDYLKEKRVTFHGSVVRDPVSDKQMIIILDPDGNRIQLFEK